VLLTKKQLEVLLTKKQLEVLLTKKQLEVLLTKKQLEAFGSHPSKCSLSVQVRVYKCICVSCLYSHICRTITL